MPPTTKKDDQRRWLPAIIACFVLIGAAMWASVLLPTGDTPADAPRNTSTTGFAPQTLRAWDGKLARFEGDSTAPAEVYDVVIATLPEEAQQELQQGITVTSEQELAALLENYTS